ncbi:MAG: hypothetical protein E7218_02035 [Anaerofustis stercorihominis]|nr:hypothetical protein [Anaerofustis stercorihominis]
MGKDSYQEFHHGEREYCRESGPLKRKKIGFTSASALASGLELVSAAVVMTAVVAVCIAFTFVSGLVSVGTNNAVVRMRYNSLPEDVSIRYVLTLEDDGDIVYSGTVGGGQKRLNLTGLDEETSYIISFYRSDNGDKLDETRFTTGGNDMPDVPPADDPPVTVPEDDIPPSDNDPAVMPEANDRDKDEEDIPADKPTEDDKDEEDIPADKPTEDDKDEEDIPTDKPTEDDKDEGEDVPGDIIPEEPKTAPVALPVQVKSAEKVYDSSQNVLGYEITEIHTFENVEDEDYTVVITYSGNEVSAYEAVYDSENKTLTVTFTGAPTDFGQTAHSSVSVSNEGGTAVSENSVTTPNLESMNFTVTGDGNGTFTYLVEGKINMPSVGNAVADISIYPDIYEASDDSEFMQMRSFSYDVTSGEYSASFSAYHGEPGIVFEALASAGCSWSIDENAHIPQQVLESTEKYVSEGIRFMNYRGPGGDIRYDVEATFLTPDIASVKNAQFVWELLPFDTEFGSSGSSYVTDVFEATSVEFDPQTGYAKAVFEMSDENDAYGMGLSAQGDEYRWTVNLEYTDSAGTVVSTPDCIAKISFPYAIIADMRSVSYSLGENLYVDFTYERTFTEFYDGELYVSKSRIYLSPTSWSFVGEPEVKVDGNVVTISGTITGTEPTDTGLQVNCDWIVDGQIIEVGYIGSSITTSVFPTDPTMSYDENTAQYVETHRFENVEENYSYHNYVSISTADGNEYTVIYDEQAVTTDPTGCVVVEWLDENGDTVVTVRRNAASAGDETVVRHYMWDELNYARSTFTYDSSDIQ